MRADGVVTVTVNGKPEQTTVQELINNYSGKVNWDRRNGKLHEEEKSLARNKENFDHLMGRLHELAIDRKDPIEAMNHLGEAMGWDMDQFWQETTKIGRAHV